MNGFENTLKLIISEIEKPSWPDGLLKGAADGGDHEEALRIFASCAVDGQRISIYEAIASFVKSYDFIMARNLMLFGLLTAFVHFAAKPCGTDEMIFFLYGAAGFYLFLVLLSPSVSRKHRRYKEKALRSYREKLILAAISLIKKHRIDRKRYPVCPGTDQSFMNLENIDGKLFFRLD